MPVPAGYLSGSPAAAFASSASLIPPPPINTQQPGVVTSLLYSGSKFRGHQKSKGNSYDVEVVLQVGLWDRCLISPASWKGIWWSVKRAVWWLTGGKSMSPGLSSGNLASWECSSACSKPFSTQRRRRLNNNKHHLCLWQFSVGIY